MNRLKRSLPAHMFSLCIKYLTNLDPTRQLMAREDTKVSAIGALLILSEVCHTE